MKKMIKYIFILFFSVHLTSCAQNQLAASFSKKVEKEALMLKVKNPDVSDPVSLTAKTVWNDAKKQAAVIIKAKILAGWHIYSFVPQNEPYLQCEIVLEAPSSMEPLSQWIKPESFPFEGNIFVYEGEITFIRYFSVKELGKDANIKAGLFYQTCDIRQCLPPDTKTVELKL